MKVDIDAEGQTYLQGQPIEVTQLVASLTKIADPSERIYLSVATKTQSRKVLEVMTTLRAAGYFKISLGASSD